MLKRCRVDDHWIEPTLGALPYGAAGINRGADGSKDEPCAPGDWDDICDHCYADRLDESR